MSSALALSGWLLAAAALGAALLTRIRFVRHREAVARASHELRGPLTAVRLGLELGARVRPASPRRQRAVELELGRAALALEDLEALRMGRPAGAVSAERNERVDISELVNSSVEAWCGFAAVHGVRLRAQRSGPRMVLAGDRLRLAQAVGNLIANAIEHGGGAVEVSLRRASRAIRIEIADTGPGLPAPLGELVRGSRRGRGQRGHGLAIVSEIAAAHGGRLIAVPGGGGAHIVLELPATGDGGDLGDLAKRPT